MLGYKIGDRVEVLWQGELFAATIIYIHDAEGACDAAYEIDDSVGVFLTAEEHGLKLLPARPNEAEAGIAGASGNSADHHGNDGNEDTRELVLKRPPRLDKGDKTEEGGPACVAGGIAAHKRKDRGSVRKLCSIISCSSFVQKDGLCKKHGNKCNTSANGICSTQNCTANVVARGVCVKHGANGLCSAKGCVTYAQARGVCIKHGAKRICSVPGCTTNAQARGVCIKHGAKGLCSAQYCTTNASSLGGVCIKRRRNREQR